jgi:outer membrane protein OmpA-like peptidoglycan-associated protein
MRIPVVLTLLGWSGAASAADGAVGGGIFGGVFLPDELEVLGRGPALSPRFGYWINPTFGVELDLELLVGGQTQVGVPETFSYTGILPVVNMVGRVFEDKPVSLVLNVGAGPFLKSVNDDGALELPTGENLDVDFAGVAGPGFLVPIGDLAIRGDIRFVLNVGSENRDNHGDSFISWIPAVGVMYLPLGPRDTDKDGLTDELDRCLDQAEDLDAFDDQDGCPDTDNDQDLLVDTADSCPNEPEDVDTFEDDNGCPDPDNDQDGVLDEDDTCPAEAGTSATEGCPDADSDTVMDSADECVNEAGSVDAFGCPDRDGDLVPDHRDECPDEKAPDGIDPKRDSGCVRGFYIAAAAIVVTETIQFDSGRATIKAASNKTLDGIAALLVAHPDIKKVEVGAHTDSQGDDAANQALSEKRATAVKDYLVKKGVDAGRIDAVGYGETKPIGDNATAAGRTQNRRVEIDIKE